MLFGATEPSSLLGGQENPLSLLTPSLPCFSQSTWPAGTLKGLLLNALQDRQVTFLIAQGHLLFLPFTPSPQNTLCLHYRHVSGCKHLCLRTLALSSLSLPPVPCTEANSGASHTQLFHPVSLTGSGTHIPEAGGLTSKMTLSFSFSLSKSSTKTLTARSDLGP